MRVKTKIIGGIVLAAVLGATAWFLYSGRSEITFDRVSPEELSKVTAILSKDSDTDGLMDWEEELWHTDPNNPDSDGDGTNDGEEIREGRDPLKSGPDDELDQETIEGKTVPGGGSWSETDRISRELFGKYLAIKQSGKEFTAEDQLAIMEDLLTRYPEPLPLQTYTEKDILLSENNDPASWRAYGNAIGAVIQKHAENAGEGELVIFERALQNEDALDLAQLKKRVERYENMRSDFSAIPVPSALLETHLSLINSIEALKSSVVGMSMALADSVRAMSAAVRYPSAINQLTDTFVKFATFFSEKKIVFEEGEAGSILTK